MFIVKVILLIKFYYKILFKYFISKILTILKLHFDLYMQHQSTFSFKKEKR